MNHQSGIVTSPQAALSDKLEQAFDRSFYLATYPDVRTSGIEPLEHFCRFGWKEGRDPNPTFSTRGYLARHPLLWDSGLNPLLHSVLTGTASGQADPPERTHIQLPEALASIRPVLASYFDAAHYARNNPDVAATGVDYLDHYLVAGWREGRDPCAGFSTRQYLQANPDVAATDLHPFLHFLVNGQAEGRLGQFDDLVSDLAYPSHPANPTIETTDRRNTPRTPPQACDRSLIEAPLPRYFLLEVASHCNLRCPHCPTGNGTIPMADRGYLSEANFDVLFDRIRPHARVVDLFSWGEPFMHKGLLGFVERFSAAGIKTQISSNLSVRLFSQAELQRIVLSGLHALLASIDGVSQAAYQAYRRNGSVGIALRNLANLREMRDRLGSRTPYLTWAFYLNRFNENEVDQARALAAEIGVDIWFRELSCPPEFQSRLVTEAPDILTPPPRAERLWIPRVNLGLGSLVLDSRLPSVCNVCRMPFEVLNINFNGDVYPCTAVTGHQFRVGNLVEQPIEEIWRRMRRNRRQLLRLDSRDPESQCGRCVHLPPVNASGATGDR